MIQRPWYHGFDYSAEVTVNRFLDVMNNSLSEGIVPELWKLSGIVLTC